jgi:hypothetical protein
VGEVTMEANVSLDVTMADGRGRESFLGGQEI